MPPFKDDQIIIISPGSETTLAQLGLPESFTPAAFRIRSRMFPGEKAGEWEPNKIRKKGGPGAHGANGSTNGDTEVVYEEDFMSEEGAVWPIAGGKIVNWSCFFALMTHVYNTLNPPFHTPILLIAQPVWTMKDHEKITQFFFERFKMPAFALMDSAVATMYAYGVQSATVIDIGKGKCDVTAISEFLTHEAGRTVALENAGGEAMTKRLLEVIKPKDKHFSRDMAEQLKKSPICEILPVGTQLPGPASGSEEAVSNPAAAASTGAAGSGPGQRDTGTALGAVPLGPGPDTVVGDEANGDDESEGVIDVASIVTGGKMQEYLAKKEREKLEKDKNKKKNAADAAAANIAKPARLPNSKREKGTFMYEDHKLLDTLKEMNLSKGDLAEMRERLDEGPKSKAGTAEETTNGDATSPVASGLAKAGSIKREIEVGTERFQAVSGGILESIADAVHKTITSVEEVNKRSELWDSLIIVGNGAKIRGFKDALMSLLQAKYLISPSSATIFTSELPSTISTPAGTGANTPQPQLGPHGGSGVNPLLLAATTAQNPHMMHPGQSTPASMHSHNMHSSHGQTPTSIKIAKVPEYFPEWKEVGYDESTFLGAQVAAKVLFVVDQGLGKGYMTRNDWNDSGPTGIHDFAI
ncbi:actin-related protein, ARP9 class [Pseudovirgaria hyperparasitica]|uniref:Actin-related protein, ARP9 class n=1 Tax=Pseudovirgaria hyperparasitica TaxID=470096 RepID=A0A6A6WFZ6_9PEZI|nr:actin-related protein, ARP9 class [Pseudovirgaria hyperparasitica]KAF2760984.1 actin-related protein, ARP9 class [Pseudovirgaria hyperparasitica]